MSLNLLYIFEKLIDRGTKLVEKSVQFFSGSGTFHRPEQKMSKNPRNSNIFGTTSAITMMNF